jgi:integrase
MTKSRRGGGGIYRPKYRAADGFWVISEFWWIRYRGLESQNGRRKQFFENSHSTKKTVAEKLLNNRLSEITTGSFVGPDAEKIPFIEIADLYMKEWKADYHGEYVKNQERTVNRLKEFFGKCTAVVAADKWVDYKLFRQGQGYAPETISKDRKAFEAIYGSAVRAKKLNRSHCPEIKREKGVDNRRTERFTEEEYQVVLAELKEDLRPFAIFASITGLRPKTMKSLSLNSNVDQPASGRIFIPRGITKTKKDDLIIPYANNPDLKAVIEGQRSSAHKTKEATGKEVTALFHYGLNRPSHLVGKPISDYGHAFKKALEKAGIENRIFYDLKRTARTRLRRAGVADRVAMKLMNHRTLVMSAHYDEIEEQDLQEAMGKLANYQGQEPVPPQPVDPPKQEPEKQEPMEEEERVAAVGGSRGVLLNFPARKS